MISHWRTIAWASCPWEIAACACVGNTGNVFPATTGGPDMHHGTCVTHVQWCTPGSLSQVSFWSRSRGKRYRHSRCMRNPQFYVSGKRPMTGKLYLLGTFSGRNLHVMDWSDVPCSPHIRTWSSLPIAVNILRMEFKKFHDIYNYNIQVKLNMEETILS